MNAERLYAIVKSLTKEVNEKNLLGQLQNVVSALRGLGNQQAIAQNQQNLATYRTGMFQALSDSPSDRFSPAWRQLLREIGGEEFFGTPLKQKIEATIAENQLTPVVAADQLETLRQRMEKFQSALTQANSAFGTFRISDETLKPGECEVGILIPRAAVDNRLIPFAEELTELSFILNTFSEVATSEPATLEIKTISSSGLVVYLLAIPPFAACLAKSVSYVVDLYKKLLEIRKIQLEIHKLGLPDESAKGIEDYANSHMANGIEKVSVEIVNEFYKGDSGRKHELTTAVRISLNRIANRIDNGYNIKCAVRRLPQPTIRNRMRTKKRPWPPCKQRRPTCNS